MNAKEILEKVSKGELSAEEGTKLLAEAETKKGGLYCKVSAKGAVSVYGLQRMPVTLYVEQWERLMGFAETLQQFMKDHESELSRKAKD